MAVFAVSFARNRRVTVLRFDLSVKVHNPAADPDTGQQFLSMKGLGQVVVGSSSQAAHDLVDICHCGQYDDIGAKRRKSRRTRSHNSIPEMSVGSNKFRIGNLREAWDSASLTASPAWPRMSGGTGGATGVSSFGGKLRIVERNSSNSRCSADRFAIDVKNHGVRTYRTAG